MSKTDREREEDRYAECDCCGEKYWGEDIKRYLREVEIEDEVELRCPRCLRK